MINMITSKLSPEFIKYGFMAVIVVAIELVSFTVMISQLRINYLFATIISLAIGILLNWLGSRYFVFGKSKHSTGKEFTLVAITSLAGVLLQIVTVFTAVEILNMQPLPGKVAAIIITFFWNYLARKKIIYK